MKLLETKAYVKSDFHGRMQLSQTRKRRRYMTSTKKLCLLPLILPLFKKQESQYTFVIVKIADYLIFIDNCVTCNSDKQFFWFLLHAYFLWQKNNAPVKNSPSQQKI